MAQVENEYGSYGNDAEYMGKLRQAMIDGGFRYSVVCVQSARRFAKRLSRTICSMSLTLDAIRRASFRKLRELQPDRSADVRRILPRLV